MKHMCVTVAIMVSIMIICPDVVVHMCVAAKGSHFATSFSLIPLLYMPKIATHIHRVTRADIEGEYPLLHVYTPLTNYELKWLTTVKEAWRAIGEVIKHLGEEAVGASALAVILVHFLSG